MCNVQKVLLNYEYAYAKASGPTNCRSVSATTAGTSGMLKRSVDELLENFADSESFPNQGGPMVEGKFCLTEQFKPVCCNSWAMLYHPLSVTSEIDHSFYRQSILYIN